VPWGNRLSFINGVLPMVSRTLLYIFVIFNSPVL
jgi:hypothetical protein